MACAWNDDVNGPLGACEVGPERGFPVEIAAHPREEALPAKELVVREYSTDDAAKLSRARGKAPLVRAERLVITSGSHL